jgi:hypothetical protein
MQIIITIYKVWKQIMMYFMFALHQYEGTIFMYYDKPSKSIPRKFSQIGGLNYDPHIRLLLVQE